MTLQLKVVLGVGMKERSKLTSHFVGIFSQDVGMVTLMGLEEHTEYNITVRSCLASNNRTCSPPLTRYAITHSRGIACCNNVLTFRNIRKCIPESYIVSSFLNSSLRTRSSNILDAHFSIHCRGIARVVLEVFTKSADTFWVLGYPRRGSRG